MKTILFIPILLVYSLTSYPNQPDKSLIDLKSRCSQLSTIGIGAEKALESELVKFVSQQLEQQNFPVLIQTVDWGAKEKQSNDWNQKIQGEVILSVLAQKVEKDLKNRILNRNDIELKQLVETLEANQYSIDAGMTDQEKFLYHLRNGNFSYIVDRLGNRLERHKVVIVLCLLILIGTSIAYIFWKKRPRKPYLSTIKLTHEVW